MSRILCVLEYELEPLTHSTMPRIISYTHGVCDMHV